jgi:RHS repeat-associated protein
MTLLPRLNVTQFVLAMVAACALLSEAHAQSCPMPGGNPSCGSSTTSQSSPNPSTGVGNPIDLTSGNKYQQEADIEMPGDLSIGFTRHYNSLLGQPGVLGRGWSHTYETRLSRTETPGAAGTRGAATPQITLIQSDGRVISFQQFEATPTVRRYRSKPSGYGLIEEDLGAIERLRGPNAANRALTTDQFSVWKWHWADGRTLTFNGRGLLKTIARPDGRALQVEFDTQRRFSKVTDSSGNWLEAAYWDNATDRLEAFNTTQRAANRGGGYRGRLKTLTLSSGERLQYEYDARGNLNDVVYADGTIRRYEYDGSSGRDMLSKIFGRDGRLFSSYEYDSGGHATRSSHPDHRDDVKVSYQWPGPKQPLGHTTVEDNTGAKTTYDWRVDGQGSPVLLRADGPGCRTCAAGNVRYEYDANQRVTKIIRVDASGAPIEQVISSVDELGRTRAVDVSHFTDGKTQAPDWRETREYRGNDLLPALIVRPSVVPGHEHTLQVEYNERGQPTRITEKGYQFDESRGGLLRVSQNSWQSSQLERVTTLTYTQVHGLSLLQSVDGPLPGAADTWSYEYDPSGRLRTVTHPQHVVERFERDTWGRVTAHTGLDGVRETLQYAADGNIQRFARGDTWMQLRYDDAGRISQVFDSLGQQLTLTRDDAGELIQIGDAAGNRIKWSYGERGDVRDLVLLNPDGSLSQRGHPANVRSAVDAAADRDASIPNEAMLSSVARALPDGVAAAIPGLHSNQQAGSAESPVNGATRAQAMPGVRTVYDAQRRATSYVYDDFGRLTAEHSPVSGATRFRWDEADHLIERLAADESVTKITRDALGRAIRIRAGPEDGRIEWGAANRPTRITFLAGEERFEYDTQARLTAHALLVDGKQFRISYEFDSLGRILRKHLPDGSVLRYRYNGALHPKPGILAGIYKEGIVDRPIITDLNAPDERFADRGFTFGNGLSQRQVLDVDGRLVSDGNPKVGQSHLDWSRQTGSPATYTRTSLVGDQAPTDAIPPLSARVAASVTEFGESEGFQTTKADANPYFVSTPSFDARGQLLEDSERRYEWDPLGRLTRVFRREKFGFIKVSTPERSEPASRVIAEYRYNLFGERISKITHGAQGAKLTYFVWDGAELAAEIDQNGKVLRDYVYLDGRPVALLSGRTIDFIHTDHRLAPVAVTDSNRHVVWQADVHDNGAADVLAGSKLELPLRASNQYFDAETGLHYNVYRYLDAKRGRYLSPDPMGLAAGPDLYQFALGQPHRFVDPLGLQTTPANTDVSGWSFAKKLTAVFQLSAKKLPAALGNELLNLVSPKNVAITVGIFALWATSHAYGVGELFDAVALAAMYVSLGSQAVQIISGLIQSVSQINGAKCYSDLNTPAATVAKALSATAGVFVQAAVLHKLFGSAEADAGAQADNALAASVEDGEASTITLTTPKVSFDGLIGKQFSAGELTNIAARNDGVLGEQVASQILEEQTGIAFEGIQNASNNGPDLIAIVPGNNGGPATVLHVEVKSSVTGNPQWPKGSGQAKFDAWIQEAANKGTIAGKPLSEAQIQYAKQIQAAMRAGAKVENTVMQVNLPRPGTSGVPTATLSNWP